MYPAGQDRVLHTTTGPTTEGKTSAWAGALWREDDELLDVLVGKAWRIVASDTGGLVPVLGKKGCHPRLDTFIEEKPHTPCWGAAAASSCLEPVSKPVRGSSGHQGGSANLAS